VLVCNAASNPHYGPMATISDAAFRKTLDNILAQHWLVTMMPEMCAQNQLHHPDLLGRRAARPAIPGSMRSPRRPTSDGAQPGAFGADNVGSM
jgi:hypothetical protein